MAEAPQLAVPMVKGKVRGALTAWSPSAMPLGAEPRAKLRAKSGSLVGCSSFQGWCSLICDFKPTIFPISFGDEPPIGDCIG